MPAFFTAVVLIGSFVATFALMRGIQRLQGPALQPSPALPPRRPSASPVGPDDDLAFLRELRRRIDLGHFRR